MSTSPNQQLLEAADRGDLAGVQEALAQGAKLDAKGAVDMDALTLAVRGGHTPVVRFLVAQGAPVTHDTLLVASMSAYSNVWLLKLLQLAQMRQVRPQVDRRTPADAQLLTAAFAGDLDGVRAALQSGANPQAADEQDTAALRWATRAGHRAVVEALLAAGADVNQKSATGWTALMEAVCSEHPDLVVFLLAHGADPNVRTFANASALYFARDLVWSELYADCARAERIVQLLVESGAQYNSPDEGDDD
jgi:ankyrin repeat protein